MLLRVDAVRAIQVPFQIDGMHVRPFASINFAFVRSLAGVDALVHGQRVAAHECLAACVALVVSHAGVRENMPC